LERYYWKIELFAAHNARAGSDRRRPKRNFQVRELVGVPKRGPVVLSFENFCERKRDAATLKRKARGGSNWASVSLRTVFGSLKSRM